MILLLVSTFLLSRSYPQDNSNRNRSNHYSIIANDEAKWQSLDDFFHREVASSLLPTHLNSAYYNCNSSTPSTLLGKEFDVPHKT